MTIGYLLSTGFNKELDSLNSSTDNPLRRGEP